jgi:hypothetical protein
MTGKRLPNCRMYTGDFQCVDTVGSIDNNTFKCNKFNHNYWCPLWAELKSEQEHKSND